MRVNLFAKLHGPTRGGYTGGIYKGHELSHFVGNERFGAMYPFLMAGPHKARGMRSSTGVNIGFEHIGAGA